MDLTRLSCDVIYIVLSIIDRIICIFKIQETQYTTSVQGPQESVFTNSDWQFHKLVEHLDHAFLHGLRHITNGYWVIVQDFTHKATVREIKHLQNVTTNLGRGRFCLKNCKQLWKCLCLNKPPIPFFWRFLFQIAVYYWSSNKAPCPCIDIYTPGNAMFIYTCNILFMSPDPSGGDIQVDFGLPWVGVSGVCVGVYVTLRTRFQEKY